jgi:hypothetical protein
LAELDPALWTKTNPNVIGLRPGGSEALKAAQDKHGYQIVYLALENTPAKEYRRVRTWIELKGEPPDALVQGPVLGRMRYADTDNVAAARKALVGQVRQRFTGPLVAVVRTSEAAEQYLALGIRPIAMGGGDFPQGVTPIKTWAELPAALAK